MREDHGHIAWEFLQNLVVAGSCHHHHRLFVQECFHSPATLNKLWYCLVSITIDVLYSECCVYLTETLQFKKRSNVLRLLLLYFNGSRHTVDKHRHVMWLKNANIDRINSWACSWQKKHHIHFPPSVRRKKSLHSGEEWKASVLHVSTAEVILQNILTVPQQ